MFLHPLVDLGRFGDVHSTGTDHRPAASAGAEFCEGHPYRHKLTLPPWRNHRVRPIIGVLGNSLDMKMQNSVLIAR